MERVVKARRKKKSEKIKIKREIKVGRNWY